MPSTYTAEYWDHRRDELKHEPRPGERDYVPLSAEPKPMTTALEIAVLAQTVDITTAANLIEQFGNTRAAEGRLEGVGQLDRRLSVALESPLTPATYGGGDVQP